MVSLFPATWKDRANGMRPDLAETIAKLKPAFLRFPGGSFVSEHNVDFAPRGKKTLRAWRYRPRNRLGTPFRALRAGTFFCRSSRSCRMVSSVLRRNYLAIVPNFSERSKYV